VSDSLFIVFVVLCSFEFCVSLIFDFYFCVHVFVGFR
jgi:hypothetical protein